MPSWQALSKWVAEMAHKYVRQFFGESPEEIRLRQKNTHLEIEASNQAVSMQKLEQEITAKSHELAQVIQQTDLELAQLNDQLINLGEKFQKLEDEHAEETLLFMEFRHEIIEALIARQKWRTRKQMTDAMILLLRESLTIKEEDLRKEEARQRELKPDDLLATFLERVKSLRMSKPGKPCTDPN